MSNSRPIGTEFSRKEALEILDQCHKLRESADRLSIRAMKSLRTNLRVVDGKRCELCGQYIYACECGE